MTLAQQYKKAYNRLKSNIKKVQAEGFETINLPSLVKKPTKASLRRLEKLNNKVLNESFITTTDGKDLTRKQLKNRARLQGKGLKATASQYKVVTQKDVDALYSNILGDIGGKYTQGMNIKVVKLIEKIESTIMHIQHDYSYKNGHIKTSLVRWGDQWRSILATWLRDASEADLIKAADTYNSSDFDITIYDSDGIGLQPFIDRFDDKLAQLTSTLGTQKTPEEKLNDILEANDDSIAQLIELGAVKL